MKNIERLRQLVVREYERVSRSSMAHNAGWMLLGQGASFLLQAVYFVILARLLGAREYGIYAGAFAFTTLVSQFSTLGTGTVMLRYVSGARENFGQYWGNVLLSTLPMCAALIAVLSLLGSHLLNKSSAALVFWAALSNCLFGPMTGETARVFQAFEKMRVTAVLNLLANLVRTLLAAGLLIVEHHATASQWAVASTAVTGAAAIAGFVLVTVYFGRPVFRPHLLRKHWFEGLEYSFASSTTSVYNDLDKTMLSHYGMNTANGIYTMAYRVIDIASMPITSVRDASLPRFFKAGRTGILGAAELLKKLFRRTLVLSVVAAVAIFITAPLIVRVVGHGFAESATALRWLCLIPVFRSVHMLTGWTLTCAGFQRVRTISQVAVAGLNFGLNLWLIPIFGWYGAAWSSLASDGLLAVFNWGVLRVMTYQSSREQGALSGSSVAAVARIEG